MTGRSVRMPAPLGDRRDHADPGLGRQVWRAAGVPLKPVQRFVTG